MSIAARLTDAIRMREKSIREFQRDLKELEVPGSSYPAVHRYLSGKVTPSLEFIEGAAHLLRVRPAWLAYGDAPIEQEEGHDRAFTSEFHAEMASRVVTRLLAERQQPFAFLYADDPFDLKLVLQRFSQKLTHTGITLSEWEEEHLAMLRAAALFIRGVETALLDVAYVDPGDLETFFLMRSESPGWRIYWMEAVLELFSRRIKGFGERTGHLNDAHDRETWQPPRRKKG